MNSDYIMIAAIAIAALLALIFQKVDLSGSVSGFFAAIIVLFGGGTICLVAFAIFFVLGTLASSWKKGIKTRLKVAQENEGRRSVSNVMANSGVAILLALAGLFLPEIQQTTSILILAVFATACSDTLSSELGTVYGKHFFSITTWRPATRGLDGVVSGMGMLFGLLGSTMVSMVVLVFWQDYRLFGIIAISGLLGNVMDSILGATWQRRGLINNHHVNFLATGFGALICWVLLFML